MVPSVSTECMLYIGHVTEVYLEAESRCLWARKIEVPVLDATAIGVSVCYVGISSTAGSVMFLLGIGEILEEWTHKKSVDDLARTMSLNVEKGMAEDRRSGEVLVPAYTD